MVTLLLVILQLNHIPAALQIASCNRFSNIPYSLFTLAAAFFSNPKAYITGKGIRSSIPPILKYCKDLILMNEKIIREQIQVS